MRIYNFFAKYLLNIFSNSKNNTYIIHILYGVVE